MWVRGCGGRQSRRLRRLPSDRSPCRSAMLSCRRERKESRSPSCGRRTRPGKPKREDPAGGRVGVHGMQPAHQAQAEGSTLQGLSRALRPPPSSGGEGGIRLACLSSFA